MYKFTVRAVEGRNLASKDSNGLSDPYLKIKLSNRDQEQRFRTKIIYKTLNPTWDQLFDFKITDPQLKLIFTCMDRDLYSSDDFMGRFEIPIQQILDHPQEYRDKWFTLETNDKGELVSGEIRLRIDFEKMQAIPQTIKSLPANIVAIPASIPKGVAKKLNLKKKKKSKVLVCLDVVNLPFTTYSEKFGLSNTRNSNEILYEFILHCIEFPYHPDHGSNGIDTKSTEFTAIQQALNISATLNDEIRKRVAANGIGKESILKELEHRLAITKSHPHYTKSNFPDDQSWENWRYKEIVSLRSEIARVVFDRDSFKGRLSLTFHEAKDVLAMDLSGTSDPYCLVKIDEQEKARTKVKKKTLAPIWNETFVIDIYNPNTTIVIDIWDQDLTSTHDFMGNVQLDVMDFILSRFNPVDKWFNISTQGSLRLGISFEYPYAEYVKFGSEVAVDKLSEDSQKRISKAQESPKVDYHQLYITLVKTIVSKLSHSNDDFVESDGFSLLREFEDRFGIDPAFSRLCYLLHYDMQPKLGSLETIEEHLEELNHVQKNDYTKEALEMHKKVHNKLGEQIRLYLQQYKQNFPKNYPPGAFRTAVSILESLCAGDQATFTNLIQSYLTDGMKRSYEEKRSNIITETTGIEVIKLVDFVIKEIESNEAFADTFPKQFDFIALSSQTYYSFVRKEVIDYCQKDVFNDQTFDLYFKLKGFHEWILKKTKKDSSYLNLLNLGQVFLPFMYQWLKQTINKGMTWIDGCIQMDKRQPISKDVLHSSSVLDVFSTLSQSFEFMKSLEIQDLSILSEFAMVVYEFVKKYTTEEHKLVEKALEPPKPEETKNFAQKLLTSSNPEKVELKTLKIQVEDCISINNIHTTRLLLDKFSTDLEAQFEVEDAIRDRIRKVNQEVFEQVVRDNFQLVKQQLDNTLSFVANSIYTEIFKLFILSLSSNDHHTLFDYMDDILTVLHDNLYPSLFKKILQLLWTYIASGLKSTILGEQKIQLNHAQLTRLCKDFQELRDYFYAGGEGLSEEFLSSKTKFIEKIAEISEMKTSDLVKYHKTKRENPSQTQEAADSGVKLTHIEKLLALRTDDKEAMAYLDELKGSSKKKSNPSNNNNTNPLTESDKIRSRLLLADSELILDSYSISYNGSMGNLYLTSSYIVWDVLFGSNPDDGKQLAIKLAEIKSIKRHKKFFTDYVDITAGKQTYPFSSLMNREAMIKDIIKQASNIGNKNIKLE